MTEADDRTRVVVAAGKEALAAEVITDNGKYGCFVFEISEANENYCLAGSGIRISSLVPPLGAGVDSRLYYSTIRVSLGNTDYAKA